VGERREVLEAGHALPEVDHPARAHRIGRAIQRAVPQEHQAVGVRERQRPQQCGVDDAEGSAVLAPMPRRQREDGDGRRSPATCRVPAGVATSCLKSVLMPCAHGSLDGGEARRLAENGPCSS
jgi:hypothetical protein